LLGVVLGTYVGFLVGKPWLVTVHVLSAVMLWFYSTFFKKRMISGNLIISALTALVPLMVFFYIIPSWQSLSLKPLLFYALLYSGFAFLVSMMREIVKDMQDMYGDANDDCCTLPIVAGLKTSKIVVDVLGLMVIAAVGVLQVLLLPDRGILLVLFPLFFIQVPVVFILTKLKPADRSADFRILSYFIKAIMLAGILTMPWIALTINPATLL